MQFNITIVVCKKETMYIFLSAFKSRRDEMQNIYWMRSVKDKIIVKENIHIGNFSLNNSYNNF